MIPADFSSALANHLWQSTLVAGAAGLLALALRKNHARVRYCVWLVASVKFLVPFSLLVALGHHIGWSPAASQTASDLSLAVEQIGRPFIAPAVSLPVAPQTAPAEVIIVPAVLFAIWLCGALAVAACWSVRWRRIRAAVRSALPLPLEADLPVLSSPALLEPGVFGITRPVLLLPEGILDRMAPEHFGAILAHESCHVSRRDNLTAAIHMAVEAAFWFHPLVWWLGVRLVEERERACDEEVLRLGNNPHVYAESILKTCQFYLESPLTCMSGVTGSDLKKRIVRIMTQNVAHRLDMSRKILLAAAGMAAVAVPIAFGFIHAPQSRAQSQPASNQPLPSFEVASIKPNKGAGNDKAALRMMPGGRLMISNLTVKGLIGYAYNVRDFQISGGPGWVNSERFDIEAKGESEPGDPMKMTEGQRKHQEEQLKLMMQSLLAERFKLVLQHDSKELPVYALVVAKNGPKLEAAKNQPPPPAPNVEGPRKMGGNFRGMMMRPGQIEGRSTPVSFLAQTLSQQLGRTVIDKTGLTGLYDFTLKWQPEQREGQMFRTGGDGEPGRAPADAASPDASGPSVFTALQEQLGLKLDSQKGPVEILVIQQVEQPTEN